MTKPWSDIGDNSAAISHEVAECFQLSDAIKAKFAERLQQSASRYASYRTPDELWRRCEGKEVHKRLAQALEMSSASSFRRAILQLWKDEPAMVPDPVKVLRERVLAL